MNIPIFAKQVNIHGAMINDILPDTIHLHFHFLSARTHLYYYPFSPIYRVVKQPKVYEKQEMIWKDMLVRTPRHLFCPPKRLPQLILTVGSWKSWLVLEERKIQLYYFIFLPGMEASQSQTSNRLSGHFSFSCLYLLLISTSHFPLAPTCSVLQTCGFIPLMETPPTPQEEKFPPPPPWSFLNVFNASVLRLCSCVELLLCSAPRAMKGKDNFLVSE